RPDGGPFRGAHHGAPADARAGGDRRPPAARANRGPARQAHRAARNPSHRAGTADQLRHPHDGVRSMRRRLTVAALLVAALVFTGCGRDDNEDTGGQAAQGISSGPATGTITVWAMGTEGEKLSVLAKDFEAANPGVKVNVTAVPWDSAHDKISTAIAAKTTPDVSMIGTTWMGEFAKTG